MKAVYNWRSVAFRKLVRSKFYLEVDLTEKRLSIIMDVMGVIKWGSVEKFSRSVLRWRNDLILEVG